jgi:hypothetical protein
MMILSRIWYVILALLLAAAYYVVSLAVGQYNRRNAVAMEEELKADSQVVSWALQVDARRRLDVMLLAAVDPGVAKAIRGANGKENIPPASKQEARKALEAFNEKLPAEYKNDVLFATDREGRLVAQIGYDAVNAFPEFELGGYAAVFDALHGFLRDDTWVWGGKLARVVTRPVEDEVGQPPLGAVVGLRWVDNSFAKEMGKRTRTNIAFFAGGQRVSSAATTEGFDEKSLEALGGELKAMSEDKQFRETGRTDVRPLGGGEKGGALYVRLPGDAWELDSGFAVARPKVAISSPLGFLEGADDADKRNVKLWIVLLVVLGASAIGILFTLFEHSMPMGEMARQAGALKKGEVDQLQVARFRGGYRPIAQNVNDGIQRVVEKGGGTARKPADLESILGPVPAQPSMSAFSFPMQDGSGPPQTAPNVGGPQGTAPGVGQTAPNARFPGAPPPPGAPSRPNPMSGPSPSRPGLPPPGSAPHVGHDRTMAMPGRAPGPPGPGSAGAHSATVAASPGANHPGLGGATTAPAPFGVPGGGAASAAAAATDDNEEEATMVGQPSADLIAATSGGPVAAAASDPAVEWKSVYEDFLRTKRECGEPTEGLTFAKFQQTLKKNRDALMQRHGCKRVKFSVYVKEGRASLKATPVRE